MANDANGISDELTVTLTRGTEAEVSVEPSDEPKVDDGLISVDVNVLSHLLNYHNTCNGCNLNQILGRHVEDMVVHERKAAHQARVNDTFNRNAD